MAEVISNTTDMAPSSEPSANPLATYRQERAERRGEVEPKAAPVVETKPVPESGTIEPKDGTTEAPKVEAKADKDDDGPVVSKRQQYINELIRKQTAAEIERDTLRKELEALKAPTTEEPAKAQADGDEFPSWEDWSPKNPGRTFDHWLRAQARHEFGLVQKEQERQQAQQRAGSEFQAKQKQYNERETAARTRHADYDEVAARPLPHPLPHPMVDFLLDSPAGPEIGYHLSANTAEYTRIAALPPTRMFAELTKLETALDPEKKAPAASAPTITKAPAPIPSVAAGAVTPSKDLTEAAKTASLADWRRMRNA